MTVEYAPGARAEAVQFCPPRLIVFEAILAYNVDMVRSEFLLDLPEDLVGRIEKVGKDEVNPDNDLARDYMLARIGGWKNHTPESLYWQSDQRSFEPANFMTDIMFLTFGRPILDKTEQEIVFGLWELMINLVRWDQIIIESEVGRNSLGNGLVRLAGYRMRQINPIGV